MFSRVIARLVGFIVVVYILLVIFCRVAYRSLKQVWEEG